MMSEAGREIARLRVGDVDEVHPVEDAHELRILMRLERVDGQPLPDVLNNPAVIGSVCEEQVGVKPLDVEVRDKYESMLTFPSETIVPRVARSLEKLTKFSGVDAQIYCTIAESSHLVQILREKRETERKQEELRQMMAEFSVEVEKVRLLKEEVKKQAEELSSQTKSNPPSITGLNITTPTGSEIVNQDRINMVLGRNKTESNTSTLSYLNTKPPKLTSFSGEEPVPKGEISFETWLYRVKSIEKQYTEVALREGIIRSLTGAAADLVRYLGPEAEVDLILDELQKQYRTKTDSQTLFQEFCTINQEPKEKINNYTIRLKGALDKVRTIDPDRINARQVEVELRAQFWTGLLPKYKSELRFMYGNKTVTFGDLVEAAKIIEAEKPPATVKVKAATTVGEIPVGEFEKFRQEIAVLKAGIMSVNKNGKGNGKEENRNKGHSKNGPHTSAAGPFKGGQKPVQCYYCGEWGHMKRDCPVYLKVKGRGKKEGGQPPNTEGTNNENPKANQ